MPTCEIDGARVWYDSFGEDERLPMFSSAMGFEGGGYPEILASSPTSRRVVQVQARGYGRSSRVTETPPEGWLALWADDVCRVADALGVERFYYTGVSHGGGIGWYIALRHPERLAGFISVVGTPHDREGGTASSAGRAIVQANRHDPAVIRQQFEILAGWTDDPTRLEGREHMYAHVAARMAAQDESEAAINQGKPFPEATTDEELAAILRTVDVPTLILAGMRDGVISPLSSLRGIVNVPRAKAVFWEDEGHMIAGESPARLAREVGLWLSEQEGTADPADGIVSEVYSS
ncbi:MAG: alpha/beta hydrolase [Pseudolysinimonas sp.]|uniref:alpha/beta fold hydrolase n=1 Tax=Pseudolysinimonas sp. TaxID=2680009 RepID=UPI00326641AE